MTECITANHSECLLERQLGWDDALMASGQMERKVAHSEEISGTKISYTDSANLIQK